MSVRNVRTKQSVAACLCTNLMLFILSLIFWGQTFALLMTIASGLLIFILVVYLQPQLKTKKQKVEIRRCPNCLTILDLNDKICPNCGKQI